MDELSKEDSEYIYSVIGYIFKQYKPRLLHTMKINFSIESGIYIELLNHDTIELTRFSKAFWELKDLFEIDEEIINRRV